MRKCIKYQANISSFIRILLIPKTKKNLKRNQKKIKRSSSKAGELQGEDGSNKNLMKNYFTISIAEIFGGLPVTSLTQQSIHQITRIIVGSHQRNQYKASIITIDGKVLIKLPKGLCHHNNFIGI